MSEQDLDVNSGLVIQQQTDKHQQQQQVVHLMLGDGTITSQPQLVQQLVDGSLATQQPDNHQDTIQTTTAQQISQLKVKKPQSPAVSQKELSKQWKILCKKAKEWCSLHGTFTPSFVMMYLDDNKLVWEGPDHMESFISDENVISAFLRTAVTSSVAKDKRQNTAGGYSEDSYMDTAGHQNVSEAESTVVQALEQLGQIPAHASESQSSQYLAPGGSRPAQDNPHDADTDNDDDDGDVKMQMNVTSDGQEENSDVLSEVIDSVIKEWEPGQDTRRCRGKMPPKSKRKRHLAEVQETKNSSEKPTRKRRRAAFKLPGTGTNVRLVRSSQPAVSKKSERRREKVACTQCGKVVSRNNLSAHVRLHRTDLVQEHVCSVCNKGFIKARDLKIHLTVHTGERPHKCQVCFKAFRLKVTMDEHMLTHTGEKPHICSYCNRPFARRSDLRCHIRLHTGEKPYMCNHCGRRFSLSCNYNAHLRTHTGDQKRVFGPCATCGRSFTNRKTYREHQKSHELQVPVAVSSVSSHQVQQGQGLGSSAQSMLQAHLQGRDGTSQIVYHSHSHHGGISLADQSRGLAISSDQTRGLTLTPEQARGLTLTAEQARGLTLTSEQARNLALTENRGLALTSEHQGTRLALTSDQALALQSQAGITIQSTLANADTVYYNLG